MIHPLGKTLDDVSGSDQEIIVEKDETAVNGGANINFYDVGTCLPGLFDGRDGVFGSKTSGTSMAMARTMGLVGKRLDKMTSTWITNYAEIIRKREGAVNRFC